MMTLRNAQVRATVAVSDIAAAAAFYEGTLGLSPEAPAAMDEVRIYSCGQGTLLQVYASEHAETGTATAASWSASEFDALVDDLHAKGVGFERYGSLATDDRGVHTFGEHKVAWFRDPDGNTIAVDNGGSPS